MAEGTERKDARWQIRVRADHAGIVSEAAELAGESRSEFVVAAAVDRATEVLADRTWWDLDEEQWREFNEALDAPPRDLPLLRRLLAEQPPWEQGPGDE